jgi:Predicted ATPase
MTSGSHVDDTTNLDLFRERVTAFRSQAGRLQNELAKALSINAQVLSRKLHGTKQALLTHAEVKQIIRILASWDAITTQAEAIELLSLMGLRAESFSDQEWHTAPLDRLESMPPVSSHTAKTGSTSLSLSYAPLATPSTSLIGREYHVQLIQQLLRKPSVRLLTLRGTGGVGKTRLALEVARVAQHDFAAGVFFVSLATIHDTALILTTIIQALHLAEPTDNSDPRGHVLSYEELLKNFLRDKELLLVLDNVEQLPEIALFIDDLLSTNPALKVMVTSRTILHLYGEHEFDVPPLEVGSPDLAAADPEQALQFPAIRVFVERARAVNPVFRLTSHNAATIVQICTRLDGLPLAIELAAARTKVLPLSMILQRLGDGTGQSLTFLRSTTRNVLQRYQTLQKTLDWSYDLLDPAQQRVFRRLSVFLGSWTPHAALAITMGELPTGTLDDALEQIEALIDHSLVKRMVQAEDVQAEKLEPRFYFLELIREYGLVQLEAAGELEDIQRQHALYYLALAEKMEPVLYRHEQPAAVAILILEQDNLRAALTWAYKHNETEIFQRMSGDLGQFWETRAQFEEAHRWIDMALAMTEETPAAVRANLKLSAARISLWEGRREQTRKLAEEARTLYEAIADDAGIGKANFLTGDAWHMQGEYAQATKYYKMSLPALYEHEIWRTYAFALSRLGMMETHRGNFTQAQAWLDEAVKLLREDSEPTLLAVAIVYQGILFLMQGDGQQSIIHLREGLLLAQETGHRYVLAATLIALGCLLGIMRGPIYAARICSAADILLAGRQTPLPAPYRPLYKAYIDRIKSQVDEATWDTWWSEGQTISQEEICAFALNASETIEGL